VLDGVARENGGVSLGMVATATALGKGKHYYWLKAQRNTFCCITFHTFPPPKAPFCTYMVSTFTLVNILTFA
jgi:hypothetical protein